MKHNYHFVFAALLSIFLGASAFLLFPVEKNAERESPAGPESPISRMEWEHARYADPATGKIPPHAIWDAYRQLIADGKIPPHIFASQATERTEQWQPVNDFFSSLSISKITYDPQHPHTFYFCTGEGWYNADAAVGAGVWRSTDAGNTWSQLPATDNSSFDYCQDIDVHPLTGDIYVATASSGLMRSIDSGATFKRVLNVPGSLNNSICDVEFTKNGGIFATTGIFQSGYVYYSDSGDSGTWTKQTIGFPTGIYRVELATAPSNDSVAYAVACKTIDYSTKGFYKTTDKGNTWFSIPDPGGDLLFAKQQAWYDLVLAVDPNDENTVVAGGWEQWRSKDGGNTWLRLGHGSPDSAAYQYLHVDEHAILFRNSDTIYFGNDGGIWKSGDFTADYPSIYERNYGYRVTQYYAGDMHPTAGNVEIIGGTQDNGSNKMIYSGISPQQNLSWADGGFCAINYQNPNIMYTTKNSNGIYRFINGGFGTPDSITNPYLTDDDVQFINPIVLDPTNPEILYMSSTTKGLWRLTNASTAPDSSWTQASKNGGGITALAVSKSQPHTLFMGKSSGGNIFRIEHADTTTATHAWTDCDPGNQLPSGGFNSPVSCSSIVVDPNDVNHVFVTYSNYGIKNIWESKNATTVAPTWTSHDGDLPNMPVNWIFPHPTNPDVCYIGTELGVFYTAKLNGDGTVWLPTNQGLANVRVSMLTYREADHTLLAVTHGRGMFTGTVPMNGPDYSIAWTERGPLDVGGRTRALMIDPNDPSGQTIWAGSVAGGLWKTTAIDAMPPVGIGDVPAADFHLNIFPNPATEAGTAIQFYIAKAGVTSIFIVDNSGKKIADLWNNQLAEMGSYKLKWIPSPSIVNGIYYLYFISNGMKTAKKMVVMR